MNAPEPKHDKLFTRTPIIKGHGLPIPLSLSERVRAARGVSQAVVKVASYGHGANAASRLMRYISQKGELPLETETGETLTDVDQQKKLVEHWAVNFKSWKGSRDTVHLVFSMPQGSNPEALRKSVRDVLQNHFAGHQAVFAIHQNRKHPHAHVVMNTLNQETDKRLRLNRPDLYQLREAFAAAAREQGIELAVSPRAARGVGRKSQRLAVYHLRQKGGIPQSESGAVREILEEEKTGRRAERPWESAMARRDQFERDAYSSAAEGLRAAAKTEPKDREAMLMAAQDLERFSKTMPQPKTFRQAVLQKAKKTPPTPSKSGKSQSPGQDLEH